MALALLLLLLAVTALLSVPVDLLFRIHREESLEASLTVRWMFGLVAFPVEGGKRRPAKPRQTTSPLRWTSGIRQPGFLARISRLLRRMFAAIRLRHLSLRLRLGFDDPADTGLLWAFLGPGAVLLSSCPNTALDIAPEFAGETLLLDARGQVRLIPAQLLWIVAAFALAPATLRFLWRQVVRS